MLADFAPGGVAEALKERDSVQFYCSFNRGNEDGRYNQSYFSMFEGKDPSLSPSL